MKKKFKITKAEVGSWSTNFSIVDVDNPMQLMSPEAFIHYIGMLCGRHVGQMEGLTFSVVLPKKKEQNG